MNAKLKKMIKGVTVVQDQIQTLVQKKKAQANSSVRRVSAFLELAKNELEDFRKQYLEKTSSRRRDKKQKKK